MKGMFRWALSITAAVVAFCFALFMTGVSLLMVVTEGPFYWVFFFGNLLLTAFPVFFLVQQVRIHKLKGDR